MALCFLISQRSIDTSTTHGAVLVSKSKSILSTGYNGPIKGSNDRKIPMSRPEKYAHMIHAEENALLAFTGSEKDLEGATMYITGRCCSKCLRMMLQKGIRRIVHGAVGSKCVEGSNSDLEAQKIMLEGRDVEIIEYGDSNKVCGLLNRTLDYISHKDL